MNIITSIIKIQSIRHLVPCVSYDGRQFIASVYTYNDEAGVLRTKRVSMSLLERDDVITPLGRSIAALEADKWYQVVSVRRGKYWMISSITPEDGPGQQWQAKVGSNTQTNNDGWQH